MLDACNKAVGASLKSAFNSATPAIVGLEKQYLSAGSTGTMSAFGRSVPKRLPTLTAKQLRAVYENRMVPLASSGRHLYDELLNAADGICCLCDARTAETLDHYWPKEDYAPLAFLPLNLLPACPRCNTLKSTYAPTSRNEEFLHPFFDDVTNVRWLDAELVRPTKGGPAALRYFTLEISGDNDLSERIANQFDKLHLARPYYVKSAGEVTRVSTQIVEYFGPRAQAPTVSHFMVTSANIEARVQGRNSWRAVALRTLALNQEYVEGGFNNYAV